MTAGAAQILLKTAGAVPLDGRRTVLAGQGPLLWLLAVQLLRAGAAPALILETRPTGGVPAAARRAGLRGLLIGGALLAKGLSFIAEARLAIPILSGTTGLLAEGDVRLRRVRWDGGALPCDLLLLHEGVVPATHVPLALGLEHAWDPGQRCWRPSTDAFGASSHPRVAVAGDAAGVGGWEAAVAAGRLAALDAAECVPTFGVSPELVTAILAGGAQAAGRAVEGAEDEADEAAALVEEHAIDERDALITVAASGTTPFTLGVLREAGSRGALTVGIANNPNTPILDESDHPIRLDTGAEPIAGSTRMKAGTAQRVALTLLSSLVMIRLGHVYQGLMVDVQATNSKLVRRSERMLAQLTGRGPDRVREALQQADGSVKLALLLLEGIGIGIDEARAALDRGGGSLRAAKEIIEGRKNQKKRA
jgi:N-acetylmuramic acid 6-phosphate etherase